MERDRFGTAYRAANWVRVGQTKGRTRQDQPDGTSPCPIISEGFGWQRVHLTFAQKRLGLMRRIGLSGGYSVVYEENWLNKALKSSAAALHGRAWAYPNLARFANELPGPNRSYCRYAESTTSITGRPAQAWAAIWSKNNRHQRIHPVGTQMCATV